MRDADVLVTGATGFIGSHLARRLVLDGARVHAIIRPASRSDLITDIVARVRLWTADLEEVAAVERVVASVRPQFVFHLAGLTSARASLVGAEFSSLERSLAVNVTATTKLMGALARHAPTARVVRTGGIEEYGRASCPYREDEREAPVSAYGASQVAATHVCQMLHRQTGLPVVTIRPSLVYGPGQALTFFVPALIDACLAGRDFDMTDGRQTRDLIFVDDVVEGLLSAATASGVEGQIVNISSGRDYRVLDVAELVVRLAGGSSRLRVGAVPRRANDLDRLVCDNGRARALLGWQPRTTLDDGLRACIDAMRAARPHVQPS